jgi:1,4-alpha-glucan branching enzyme
MHVFWKRYGLVTYVVGLALTVGCGSGSPPPGTQFGPEFVEGGVIFRYYDTDATRVYVVGDFNNWSVRADPMIDKNADGQWTLLYTLPPGTYEYKFVINGSKWIADPHNPATVPDGFDGVNSVLKIAKTSPKGSG